MGGSFDKYPAGGGVAAFADAALFAAVGAGVLIQAARTQPSPFGLRFASSKTPPVLRGFSVGTRPR